MPNLQVVDCTGIPIETGQTVDVQHCVGRYGATQITSGIVVDINMYYGLTLELTKPSVWHAKDTRITKQPGEKYYVSLSGEVVNGRYQCLSKFNDFEHGHESWVRVTAPAPSQDMAAEKQRRPGP